MREWLPRGYRLWQSVQVEFHREYSASRLAGFVNYYGTTSHAHALAIVTATPLPCLFAVVALDLIPLRAPDEGIARNWAFWLRLLSLYWITTLSMAILFHRALRLPAMTLWRGTIAVTSVSVCSTVASIGLAEVIGFPLPFTAQTSATHWTVLLFVALARMWGPYFRQDPSLASRALEYTRIMAGSDVLVVLYPVYIFVLGLLSPTAQGALSPLLPVTKTITQIIMSRVLRPDSDLRPEELFFNTEIFTSLFVAFTMQHSSSLLPVILLTAFDVIRAGASLYDIIRFGDDLERTHARIKSLRSAHDVSNGAVSPFYRESRSPSDSATGRCRLDELLYELLALANREDASRVASIMDAERRRAVWMARTHSDDPAATNARGDSNVRLVVNKVAPLPAPASASATGSAPQQVVVDTPLASRDVPVSKQLAHQQELLLQLGLRYLHVTEYIVLVEFAEVIIPAVYGECLPRSVDAVSHSNTPCVLCFTLGASDLPVGGGPLTQSAVLPATARDGRRAAPAARGQHVRVRGRGASNPCGAACHRAATAALLTCRTTRVCAREAMAHGAGEAGAVGGIRRARNPRSQWWVRERFRRLQLDARMVELV